MRKKSFIIFSFLVIFLSLFSSVAFAQRDLEVEYPEFGGITPTSTMSLPDYAKYIFNFGVGISGIVVFIVFVYAGIKYLTSGGNPSKISDSKNQMVSALIGILVILGSYLILTTINPQLLFFELPNRQIFEPEPIVQIDKELDSITYEEIPIGELIKESFNDQRFEDLQGVLQEIEESSEDLNNKVLELVGLMSQCSCSLTSVSCPECSGATCLGDPCPVRGDINARITEIKNDLKEKNGEGLVYLQKQLNLLLEGTPEDTPKEDEILGINKLYQDLLTAENKIKTCSNSISSNGASQAIMSYATFWNYYRPSLTEGELVKEVIPIYLFDYVPSTNLYQTNFYCAELIYSLGIAQFNLEEISLLENINYEGDENSLICGSEIKLGESVDRAKKVLKLIIDEILNIDSSITNQMAAASSIVSLANPNACVQGSCNCSCTWIEQTCEAPCLDDGEENGGGNEGGGEDETPEIPWYYFWYLTPQPVHAQEMCEYDCSYCQQTPCVGNSCPGDSPIISQISSQFNTESNNYHSIVNSIKRVNNIIDENGIEDEIKMSKIIESLLLTRGALSSCYKTEESDWKDLFSCSYLMDSAYRGLPLYNYNGQAIGDCYGGVDKMDNYFCCTYEFSL